MNTATAAPAYTGNTSVTDYTGPLDPAAITSATQVMHQRGGSHKIICTCGHVSFIRGPIDPLAAAREHAATHGPGAACIRRRAH